MQRSRALPYPGKSLELCTFMTSPTPMSRHFALAMVAALPLLSSAQPSIARGAAVPHPSVWPKHKGACRTRHARRGHFEDIWGATLAQCQEHCAARRRRCVAYELATFRHGYTRCEIHYLGITHVYPIPGYSCYVRPEVGGGSDLGRKPAQGSAQSPAQSPAQNPAQGSSAIIPVRVDVLRVDGQLNPPSPPSLPPLPPRPTPSLPPVTSLSGASFRGTRGF